MGCNKSMFKAIKDPKKFEIILEQIKDLLASGDLKVGQKLPSEVELSQMLEVSRSTLREALKVLHLLGMLNPKTGEGTKITQTNPGNLKSLMSLVAESRGLDTEELFETRIMLEMYSAKLAALRRDNQDLDLMKKYLNNMDKKGQKTDIYLDFSFHSAIVQGSKNKMLIMLMELISGILGHQIEETRNNL